MGCQISVDDEKGRSILMCVFAGLHKHMKFLHGTPAVSYCHSIERNKLVRELFYGDCKMLPIFLPFLFLLLIDCILFYLFLLFAQFFLSLLLHMVFLIRAFFRVKKLLCFMQLRAALMNWKFPEFFPFEKFWYR